jgi:hypothetical protein
VGQLEDLIHVGHENNRLLREVLEKLALLELKLGSSPTTPVPYSPYPYSPWVPQPYAPVWSGEGWGYSSTTTNIVQPQAEPIDPDHPATPAWAEDPAQDEPEDG